MEGQALLFSGRRDGYDARQAEFQRVEPVWAAPSRRPTLSKAASSL